MDPGASTGAKLAAPLEGSAFKSVMSRVENRVRAMEKSLTGVVLLLVASLGYVVVSSPDVRDQIGAAASAVARPIIIPAVELINVPAFVYVLSLVILGAGAAACLIYQVSVAAPRLADLRRIRASVGDLSLPRARMNRDAWPGARHRLGVLLVEHATFVSAWSAFAADSVASNGVPQRPFSSFAAQEPDPPSAGDDIIASLPGYFTSVGLIFTFIGLVVALYFAAKGFRSGDLGEARAAIVQLLNAASFKFLTSVSALVSALAVSLYARYATARLAGDRARTVQKIDAYLAEWRDRVGSVPDEKGPSLADILTRFDALLAGLETLSVDVRRLASHADAKAHDATV